MTIRREGPPESVTFTRFVSPTYAFKERCGMANKLTSAIFALALITGANVAGQTPAVKEATPAAKAYLQAALDVMQTNSLRKRTLDWNIVRQKALKAAAGAEVPADTYEAIRVALRELRDSRSSLELTKEQRDLEASRKPTKLDPNRINFPRPMPAAEIQKGPEGYLHRIGGQTVARVIVPAYEAAAAESSASDLRATQLQKVIADLGAANPCGWIIDLRGNTTYDLWAILAGMGSLLGDVMVGGFRDADGNLVKWFYREGKSGIHDLLGVEHNLASVDGQPFHAKGAPLLAVLIDRKTTNSAGAFAITMRGRPLTRFFGEQVSNTSATERFDLNDGASLVLTTGVYVDRAGSEYPEGLNPDEAIPLSGRNPRAAEDPVIHAALGWIGEQADCGAGRPASGP
jgi:carboxyl-terminal processing protease